MDHVDPRADDESGTPPLPGVRAIETLNTDASGIMSNTFGGSAILLLLFKAIYGWLHVFPLLLAVASGDVGEIIHMFKKRNTQHIYTVEPPD